MPVSLAMCTMSLQTSFVDVFYSLHMALSALSRMCCVYSPSAMAVLAFLRLSVLTVCCHCQCRRATLASYMASSTTAVKTQAAVEYGTVVPTLDCLGLIMGIRSIGQSGTQRWSGRPGAG